MSKVQKSFLFRGCLFANITKIVLFISNATTYVPIKLSSEEGLPLKMSDWIWDISEIDWRDVGMMINQNPIHLPTSVVII